LLVHPVIAESYETALGAGASDNPDLSGVAVEGPDLLRRFSAVSDGRLDQGRDHPVAVVLTLCAAAVLAGMCSFATIVGWVADVPAEMLARLYARPAGPPSKTTLWRVLTGARRRPRWTPRSAPGWPNMPPSGRASTLAVARMSTRTRLPSSPPMYARTGTGRRWSRSRWTPETVRGAIDAEGNQVHLLAAATHQDSLVLGQV